MDQAVQERVGEIQDIGRKEEGQEAHGDPLGDPPGPRRETSRLAIEAEDQAKPDEKGLAQAEQPGQPKGKEAVAHEKQGGNPEPLVESHRGVSPAGSATLMRRLPSPRGPGITASPRPSQTVMVVASSGATSPALTRPVASPGTGGA